MGKASTTLWAQCVWGAILLAIAAGFFSLAVDFSRADDRLSATAPGVVADIVERGGSRRNPTFYPIVAFTDLAGQRRRFLGRVGSHPAAYQRAEQVRVIYNPANPSDAMIDSFTDRYLATSALCFFGSVMALMGGWLIVSGQSAILRRR